MNSRIVRKIAGSALAAMIGIGALPAVAGDPPPVSHASWDEVKFSSEKIRDGFHVLYGDGGNIGLSVGDDGIYLIDDESSPITDKLLAAIREVSDAPIRFIINTHWHYDHAGGNETLGGEGAVIIAHDNARARMQTGMTYPGFDTTIDATAPAGLPVLTFNGESSLHLNGAEARAIYVPHAHTDGDLLVWFPDLNIIHAGDVFINGGYQFIDWFSGGSVDGTIAAMEKIIELANDDTLVIPGHGPLTGKARVRQVADMLITIRDRVRLLREQGKTVEEAIAAQPTMEWDAEFGAMMMPPQLLVTSIYLTLDGPLAPATGE